MEKVSYAEGKNGGWKERNDLTSFFFTNFPEDWDSKAFWRLFQNWGRVWEVYIPEKRDRRGRRFGFVHFLEIYDSWKISTKLDNIFIGSMKLQVNAPRFTKRSLLRNGEKGVDSHVQRNSQVLAKGLVPTHSRHAQGNRSYAQVVVQDKIQRTRWQPKPFMKTQEVQKGKSHKEGFSDLCWDVPIISINEGKVE